MSDILVFVLVFAAATSLGWVVFSTLKAAVLERAGDRFEPSDPRQDVSSAFGKGLTPVKLANFRLRAGFSGFLAVFLFSSLLGADPARSFFFAAVAGAAGSGIPVWWFRKKERKRRELVEAQILDLTTGLENGLRSGQALPAALESVSKRLPWPMSEEIATVLREYRLGLDLPDSLGRLAQRVPCEDLTLLVGSIRLTQQAGGSLAEVLEKMIEMIRGRTEFQAKLKTMTAQGRFEAIAMSLAPLAVFILLFLIDRPLMVPLVTTTAGWTAVVLDFIWVSIGFFIIKRIVTIEV